ncbi:hypothetical protein DFS34DRAFT_632253 [Phlyctochytrium arcticum]|nr:hypothetical protein DFS34DRAFT_632253 [Phlyctochytrium arcticum]
MPAICRILLTADVHCKVDNVYRLAMHLRQERFKPDFVLLCGDLLNVNNEYHPRSVPFKPLPPPITIPEMSREEQKRLDESAILIKQMRRKEEETLFAAILKALGDVSSNVFYVPGNHDPSEAFPDLHPAVIVKSPQGKPLTSSSDPLWYRMQLETGAINFHKRLISLGLNLMLTGVGGSPPQTVRGSDEVVSPGFPYTESELRSQIQKLRKKPVKIADIKELLVKQAARFGDRPGPESLILVTHSGPATLGTTDINKTPYADARARLESGSSSLHDLISSKAFQGIEEATNSELNSSHIPRPPLHVLFNVHGHSHASWGLSQLGNVPIINPGPLRDGRYATVTLERLMDEKFQQRWTLTNVTFGRV